MIVYNGVYKNELLVITYKNDLISEMSSNIKDEGVINHFIKEVENELMTHGISYKITKKFVETIKKKSKKS